MSEKKEEKIRCGLIMPISAIDGCDENHWTQVRKIIEEAVNEIGKNFEVRMVSEKTAFDLIQSNIVQALYEDKIAICDISGRNPNVMLELGMRIAFDKPVVIIFDGVGNSPFDITNILQIRYPRDLNYWKMNEFKKELKERINLVLEEEGNAFLRAFGKNFKTYQINPQKIEVSEGDKAILEKIDILMNKINLVGKNNEFIECLKDSDSLTDILKKENQERKREEIFLKSMLDKM